MKNTLVLFDFDGTLTCKNTLIDFTKYFLSPVVFYSRMLLFLPIWGLFKAKFISDTNAKNLYVNIFFGGRNESLIWSAGKEYSNNRIPQLLDPKMLELLNKHITQGHTIAIVSASCNVWLKDWSDSMNVKLISTNIKFINNKVKGITGKNCWGTEKVHRVKSAFDISSYSEIYAYGNDKSDMHMLSIAHFKYMKDMQITT